MRRMTYCMCVILCMCFVSVPLALAAQSNDAVTSALNDYLKERRIEQAFLDARDRFEQSPTCWDDVCALEGEDGGVYTFETEPVIVSSGETMHIAEPRYKKGNGDKKTFYQKFIDPNNPANEIELAVEYADYDYTESNSTWAPQFQGNMPGVVGTYTHRTHFNKPGQKLTFNGVNMFRFDTRYSYADDIERRTGTKGSYSDEEFAVLDTRAILGYDLPSKNGSLITPYSGFGYYYLNDSDGRQTTSAGYLTWDREVRYYYIPIGMDYDRKLDNKWSLRVNLEFDYLLNGTVDNLWKNLPDTNVTGHTSGGYLSNGDHQQTEGYGYRASVKMYRPIGAVDIFFEPFFRLWSIEQSTGVDWYHSDTNEYWFTTTVEDNETREYGMRMGIRF